MLDLLRIKALNVHFHTDVVSAIILTQVDQEVRNRVDKPMVRLQLFESVKNIIKQTPPRPSNPQAVIELVMNELSPFLSKEDKDLTQNLINKHVKKDHAVYRHMVKQFKAAWYHNFTNKPYTLRVPELAQCMHTETLNHATHLSTIAQLNIKVHVYRYNEMLNNILQVVKSTENGSASTAAATTTSINNAVSSTDSNSTTPSPVLSNTLELSQLGKHSASLEHPSPAPKRYK